jgi:Caspase domain
MRIVWAIVLTICLIGLFSQPALAEKRVALVIGNSDYRNVSHLPNPANDAQLVADTLKTGGFETVVLLRDINTSEMRRKLRAFADQVRDADVAVVFYAGHGVEVDGINYLIPVDAALERDIDVYDEAFSLDRVLVTIEPARRLRLVILDACRDNPFIGTMKRTIAARAVGRGLTRVEPASQNTLVAFAAKAGSTASDGDASGSPFTAALVKHIVTPGLDLRRAFGYVRDDVLKATNNRQEPYVYGSLGGDDVPLVPTGQALPGPQPNPQSEIRRDFELALQTGGRDAFEAFLRAHPDGFYADLASVQLRNIAAEEARAAAERARATAEQAAAKDAVKDAAEGAAAETKVAELAARQLVESNGRDDRVVALSVPDKTDQQIAFELPRALQQELRRVGCITGQVDGKWDATSQRALDLFNKHAGTKLETKVASADALDFVRSKAGRICPLLCDIGYQADGDRCARITCHGGHKPGDDGNCEKIHAKKPMATRDNSARPNRRQQAKLEPDAINPPAAQPVCDSHFKECVLIRTRVDGPQGSCEQRLAICRRTGAWTDRFGRVHFR